MKIGPKYKIARRLGAPIFEKTQTEKFALRESRSRKKFKKRPRSRTNFGIQLLEKQKARYTYGLTERQFSKYVKEAVKKKGSPADHLFRRLESRLDNVVYRMGLAKTRRMARQLVSHGHITLNGRKMNIPSHKVKEGDEIAIREGSRDKTVFTILKETEDKISVPTWVKFNVKNQSGTVSKIPGFDRSQHVFNLTSVIEFYSR